MFAVISDAWLVVIPTFKVLAAISFACAVVIPTFAVFNTIASACDVVIPTFAVFRATALFASTLASVKYKFVPSAILEVVSTTTPVCPLTLSTAPPPEKPTTVAFVKSNVPVKLADPVPMLKVDALPTPSVKFFSTAPIAALSNVFIKPS